MNSAGAGRTTRAARPWWEQLHRPVVALDLGEEAFRVACAGGGAESEVPARVVRDPSGRVVAIGRRAAALEACRPPGWTVCRPVARGAPADPDAARMVLDRLLAPVRRRHLWKPDIWIAEPTGATPLERHALRQILGAVPSRGIHWCVAAVALAAAAGVDLGATPGLLVVDVGAGHTSASLLAYGHTVAEARWPEGGSALTDALRSAVEAAWGVWIAASAAEALKQGRSCELRGLQRGSGSVREVTAPPGFVAQALAAHVDRLCRRLEDLLGRCAPALRLEVLQRGVLLAGGGGLLAGLADQVAAHLGAPAEVCPDADRALLNGLLRLARVPARPGAPGLRGDLEPLNAQL